MTLLWFLVFAAAAFAAFGFLLAFRIYFAAFMLVLIVGGILTVSRTVHVWLGELLVGFQASSMFLYPAVWFASFYSKAVAISQALPFSWELGIILSVLFIDGIYVLKHRERNYDNGDICLVKF